MTIVPTPEVPVSWGELLDKLTILAIKRARITRPDARANIETEHCLLDAIAAEALDRPGVAPLVDALRGVNEALWEIEDAIRAEDAAGRFGAEFIRLARAVYQHNDERAAIKRRINLLLQSGLTEEKSYVAHAGTAMVSRDAPGSGRRAA